MIQREVIPLFCRPVYKTQIDISGIDLSDIKWGKNYFNWISEDQTVLNDPKYQILAERVYQELCEFFYGVMQAREHISIAFTESWFNKTERGQRHHRHWHPNSIYSGIVYLAGDETEGRTRFISSQYETVEYNTANSNIYNSKSWSIDPVVGNMLIFPSNVEHLVEDYNSDTPRITLSFNTFLQGVINQDPLTRLTL